MPAKSRAIFLVTVAFAAAPAPAQTPGFEAKFSSFLQRLRASPYAPPGLAVAAIHDEKTLFEKAYGVRSTRSRAPLTLDTPIYNASTTKAYTGLLAAELDRKGVVPLDTSLDDIWPGLTLSTGHDSATTRVPQILSHNAGFTNTTLAWRSNFTGQIEMADVPRLLAAHSRPVSGFEYSNFGPYLYSKMAEARTGLEWRSLIGREIFQPLGLNRTATKAEQFPEGEMAFCHRLTGNGWAPVPLKPTPLLNAAGGIYSSGRDTAAFLKAFVSDGRSAKGRIPRQSFRRTSQREAVQQREFEGLSRDGYGLGWDLGSYEGRRYASRSGGAPGCRSYILWLPEEKFGVVALSTGDTAANAFNVAILKQAIDYWTGAPDADRRAEERIAAYHDAAHKAGEEEAANFSKLRERIAAAGPVTEDVLRFAAGEYLNERLGPARLAVKEGRLLLSAGAAQAEVKSLGGGDYLLVHDGMSAVESFRLIRAADGSIEAFEWDDDRYDLK